ncbi:hypothetical protein B7486_72370, partial [cyanobacterium TDX16]
QAVGRRVEAGVERDRALGQAGAQGGPIGAVVHETSGLEVGYQVDAGHAAIGHHHPSGCEPGKVPPTAPSTDAEAPDGAPDEPTVVVPGERAPRTWAKVLAGLFVLGTVGFWFWLILLAPDQEPPDKLDDPTFAEAAEPVCTEAQADVEDVPGAREAETPQERAEQITASTAILQQMVDDLRADAPTAGRDGEMVEEWLGDWETYLGDRL